MSGGHFEYKDSDLKYEIFGYYDGHECRNVFEDKEISQLVWDVLDLIHDFDWYYSGDTCKETWLEKKQKFKEKWFGNRDERVKRIVRETIAEAKRELYETFDMEDTENDTD